MRLLVTRPQEDVAALSEKLVAGGHEVVSAPLLSIQLCQQVPMDRSRVQGLLATSANGVRALARRDDFDEWRSVPLLAVGLSTAREAQALGFETVFTAGGDVVSLAQLVGDKCEPDGGPLVHLAGSVVAGDLKGRLEEQGFWIERIVLYEAVPAKVFPNIIIEALQGEAPIEGVLLFSRRTAETFVQCCEAGGLAGKLNHMTAYCLAASAAQPLEGLGLKEMRVASRPSEEALLSLLIS